MPFEDKPKENPYAASTPAYGTNPNPPAATGDNSLMHLLFAFEGRMKRGQYWAISLGWLGLLIVFVIVFVVFIAATSPDPALPETGIETEVETETEAEADIEGAADEDVGLTETQMMILLLFMFPFGLAYIWSSIAVTIKRFHDRNKSGWWYLISLVPYIGGFWIFIECGCLPGTEGPNQYGEEPGTMPPTSELRG